MSDALDPYRDWLGIDDPCRPLNYYQLLGVRTFEGDQEKLASAAIARLAIVLEHDPGPHAEAARRLFDEIEQARNQLADLQRKAAYDVALLRSQIMAEPEAPTKEPALKERAPQQHATQQPSADSHANPRREHVLHQADEQAMMVVAEDLTDSQAALLKSRLATLKSKSSSNSSASYRGFKPDKPSAPAVRAPGNQIDWLRTTMLAVSTAAVVIVGWLVVQRLLKEPPPPDPVAPLVARLTDGDEQVRLAAARSLGEMGPRIVEAVPHLVTVLETDTSEDVRMAAARSLADAGPTLAGVTPRLTLLVDREQNPTIRRMIKGLIQAGEGP